MRILLFILFITFSGICFSQSSSNGNTYVSKGGEMVVFKHHTFVKSKIGPIFGLVGTARDSGIGYVSFYENAGWQNATDSACVDGYVKTYIDTFFIFPIGDNYNYSPAAVSNASSVDPASAAYFYADPSAAITSNLAGGNHVPLPLNSPFPSSVFNLPLKKVSTTEYWDINGGVSAKISLTWDSLSNIQNLTSCISNLTIVGWDGSSWNKIDSKIDVTSILGGISDLNNGSITTSNPLIPNLYEVYSLGVADTIPPTIICKDTTVYLNSDGTVTFDTSYVLYSIT